MIDKVLKFLDDGIPKNDFDRQLLASNLVGATNLKESRLKSQPSLVVGLKAYP
ncbi:TPA: hypothetical protein R1697_001718 [Campylobacter coli]|uniref:hypothetical protein n=1 Tax=Campylobacter coli TaxID=195 RepID=UPI003828FC2F